MLPQASKMLYHNNTPHKSWGVGELWGGEEWVRSGEKEQMRPGGGRQGPSLINDWVSQHQHSQHAV